MTAKRVICAAICRDERVLLARRAPGQKHAGLWEFPGFAEAIGRAAVDECLAELGLSGAVFERTCGEAKHVFTHLVWEMTGYLYRLPRETLPAGEYRFVTHDQLGALPLATAFRFYRESLPWPEK